jgi:hypothetical protein
MTALAACRTAMILAVMLRGSMVAKVFHHQKGTSSHWVDGAEHRNPYKSAPGTSEFDCGCSVEEKTSELKLA